MTSLDLANAKEIHTIRLKLEPDATRLAVDHVTLDVLNRAEDLYSALSGAADHRWVVCNRDFHKLLLSPAPAPGWLGSSVRCWRRPRCMCRWPSPTALDPIRS